MLLPNSLILLLFFVNELWASDKILKLNVKKKQLMYGDVLLSTRQKFLGQMPRNIRMAVLAADTGSNRWPDSIVPYELSDAYTDQEKSTIRSTFDELESVSCFRFVEKTDEHEDYVYIDKQDGCYSYVGRQGGKQLFSLGEGCIVPKVIKHETLHALGSQHEQQRPDRDQYIRILYENVEGDGLAQFETVSFDEVVMDGFEYDYQSIMHYTNKAFGKVDETTGEQLITMVPKQEGAEITDGENLSEQDIRRLNVLGNC